MVDPLGSPHVAPLFASFFIYFLRGIRSDNGNRKAAWGDACRKGIFVKYEKCTESGQDRFGRVSSIMEE